LWGFIWERGKTLKIRIMKKTIAQELKVIDFPFEITNVKGNLIYKEWEDGYWARWEYDERGNKIYVENSDGFWLKREYDLNGKEIYFENSKGLWVKREWDSNGKEIYYENSKGTVLDDRPAPELKNRIIEIDGKKYKLTEI